MDGHSRGPRASFETVWASHLEVFEFVDFLQEHIWLRTTSDLREISCITPKEATCLPSFWQCQEISQRYKNTGHTQSACAFQGPSF